MGVHIIIDGYNLIRQSPVLKAIDRQDLQSGREALIDRLAAYKRLKGHKITVVFDGAGEAGVFDDRDREKGIRIRFSRQGETADAVIKRMAAREKQGALVVSSDREVAGFAAGQGAAVISAPEFEQTMEMAVLMANDAVGEAEAGEGWDFTTRKKGPSRRLTKKQRLRQKRLKTIL